MIKLVKKNLNKVVLSLMFTLIAFVLTPTSVQAQTFDLTQFIAGVDFREHDIGSSFGTEHIRFTGEGGVAGAIRQYKNSNYEQFILKTSGYYRREDTSWAPLPGFQDAICDSTGNKAIYTLDPGCVNYQNGNNVREGGAWWAPTTASLGQTWDTQNHQIVVIDSGTPSGTYNYSLPPLTSCSSANGSQYGACDQSSKLKLSAHYNKNEFTFCTGISNPEELIVLETLAGPGTGDTFYFMKGWGLVGFEVPGAFQSGLMEPGANPGDCLGGTGVGTGIQPTGPLSQGFYPTRYSCNENTGSDPEFHPMRPYPASACDPLIPRSMPEAPLTPEKKYNTFACGTNIKVSHIERFDPYGEVGGQSGTVTSAATGQTFVKTYCDPRKNPTQTEIINCWRSIIYNTQVDFRNSNLGILGNTQSSYLTDGQKVNNYLSWYFAGTPQTGDHAVLAPGDTNELNQLMDRTVNFSGPIRKLLPFDAQLILKSALVGEVGQNVHNYTVGCKKDIDLDYVGDVIRIFITTVAGNALDSLALANVIRDIGLDNLGTLGQALYNISNDPAAMNDPQVARNKYLTDTVLNAIYNNLGAIEEIINLGVSSVRRLGLLLATISLDAAEACSTSNDMIRLANYEDVYPAGDGQLPPDPRDYGNFDRFWQDYNAWRGLTYIPFFGYVDLPNPFANQSIWSELFPNIPYASLEDIAGEAVVAAFGQGGNTHKGTIPPGFNIIRAEAAR